MLTWTDFISLNHSQKSDWWASVFSESCRAGAFPCFLIVLLIWKRDYFECFKIHVDCREVWWHSHWIFLCCDFFLCVCICKLEAKLHQNETDPKRTVHRMYTLSHHILNCVIRLSRKCLFFFCLCNFFFTFSSKFKKKKVNSGQIECDFKNEEDAGSCQRWYMNTITMSLNSRPSWNYLFKVTQMI